MLTFFTHHHNIPDCDVCVVGAGPVGIALALACEQNGMSVLVLESGQEQPDRFAAALTAGHAVDADRHAPTGIAMFRGLGGTSRWWGGRCVPLDDIDFMPRAHVPNAAWPIPYQEVARWFEAAASFFGIGPACFTAAPAASAAFGDIRCDQLERWTPEIDAGRRHRSSLAQSRRITVMMGATVTELLLADDNRRVIGLTVADKSRTVRIAPPPAFSAQLLERGLLKMFYGRDEVVLLLVTYAVFLILEDVTKLIWGVNPIYATQPYELFGNLEFAGLYYVGYDLVLIPISAAIGFAIWFGLNRTVIGKIVLAVIHNEEMSLSMGVRVNRVYAVAFAFGVLLAALAGALTAPKISMQPGLSSDVIILSFAIVVIGGLGSVEGAAVGALLVGLARAASVHLMPQAELFMIYLIMAAVLMFRPEGLFKREMARRI